MKDAGFFRLFLGHIGSKPRGRKKINYHQLFSFTLNISEDSRL